MAPRCPVCGSNMAEGLTPWHQSCAHCQYEASTLQTSINVDASHRCINEAYRETGLHDLRLSNANALLKQIELRTPKGARLLEVGCAHGWFMDIASKRYDVLGLEPDEYIYRATLERGLPVRNGFFPDAIGADELFDVIVFNDVIEHISDIEGVLRSCYRHLNPGGLLVINLPSSKGVFYRLSKIACRIGYSGYFDRMWQKGLPSPHVHYFDLETLSALLEKFCFVRAADGSLPSLRLKGLYRRLVYVRTVNTLFASVLYIIIGSLLPVLRLLPSDIFYVVAMKEAGRD